MLTSISLINPDDYIFSQARASAEKEPVLSQSTKELFASFKREGILVPDVISLSLRTRVNLLDRRVKERDEETERRMAWTFVLPAMICTFGSALCCASGSLATSPHFFLPFYSKFGIPPFVGGSVHCIGRQCCPDTQALRDSEISQQKASILKTFQEALEIANTGNPCPLEGFLKKKIDEMNQQRENVMPARDHLLLKRRLEIHQSALTELTQQIAHFQRDFITKQTIASEQIERGSTNEYEENESVPLLNGCSSESGTELTKL